MDYIKDEDGNDRLAVFQFYRGGQLWYKIYGDPWLVFSVPIDDTGSGLFHRTMRAVEMMRWIRKQLEELDNE